jgi:hypothetical protein
LAPGLSVKVDLPSADTLGLSPGTSVEVSLSPGVEGVLVEAPR